MNKYVVISISILTILLIGFTHWISGSEISFSLFYLMPLIFLALQKDIDRFPIVFSAFFAAVLWLWAEYLITPVYSNLIVLFFNAFVRLVIFLLVGMIIYYLKNKQAELIIINKRLTELNDEKNKFLGFAAHDLGNPIHGIRAFSELLLSNEIYYELKNETKEIVQLIHQSSENSAQLIRNLLDVSKIESGKLVIRKTSNDYIKFLKSHIRIIQIFAQKKGIEIVFNPEFQELFAQYDEQYLSEVINNLLTNAIKYSHANSTIIIKVSRNEKGIRTEIIDQGVGIPNDEQHLLFNLFQKTSALTTAGEASSGLGLAIAKKVVTMHDGEIGVSSEKGKGSNFYFTLPD